ncbi:MAG: D-Ala-D-Ala carboxypeptidase family metallohydrolase [Leptolyngbyaceae cyanobacterium]
MAYLPNVEPLPLPSPPIVIRCVDMKAKVKNDTLFKSQPVLSSELADYDKIFVPSGSEYELTFFAEADRQHLRLELASAALDQHPELIWYVSQADVEVDAPDNAITATVQQDTLFKQRPVLSSELADTEKVFVAAATELTLRSYVPAAGKHVKLSLTETRPEHLATDTWYVRASDIQIAGQKIILKVISDTVFKSQLNLSGQVPPAEKVFMASQTTLDLQSYSEVEGNYLKVTLLKPQPGQSDRLTWYTFASDVEITGTELYNRPQDANPAGRSQLSDQGEPLNLPGFPGTYHSHDPIIAGGHFTWAQATHGATRLPASAAVVYGMIRIAEALEEVRGLLDNRPITITSWYRDPATNLRVGGAKNSRHITGDGVNFIVEGIHPYEVYARLDDWWGAQGGLASASTFTHIDARGYRVRWSYDF